MTSQKKFIRRPWNPFHVVQYSGGLGSWATATVVKRKFGTEKLRLLFADTLIEDEDLYRFLIESAADVFGIDASDLVARAREIPPVEDDPEGERKVILKELARDTREAIPGLVWIAEGRDPWQVFEDRRYLGNTRVDPCSAVLKRDFLREWMEKNHHPGRTISYIGIDWTEDHRLKKAADRWAPWTVEAPLCEPPYRAKSAWAEDLDRAGIALPRLYEMGFPHNNCGGFCVKAGMAHFKNLAQEIPERYAYHERQEADLREYLGKDVAILRDRTNAARASNEGKPVPLPLADLRLRLIEGGEIDEFDWGGCGCAI